MHKVTMLRLKRAWSLAVVTLRNRGDPRFPGKFHRLLLVRTAQKSTNTDKDSLWKCEQIINYLFSPLRTHDEIRKIQEIIISDIKRLQRNEQNINEQEKEEPKDSECVASSEAHCDKCDRIIEAIFGSQKLLQSGAESDAKTFDEKIETVLASTVKQTEEELAQKVEAINETPLVEAEQPKIEGLNTPPRVCGHDTQDLSNFDKDAELKKNVRMKIENMFRRLENAEILGEITPITGVVNYSGNRSDQTKSGDTSGGKQQDDYDSVTKQDLSTTRNELDSRFINEIKQLGVPQISVTPSIRMGDSRKRRQPTKSDVELEAKKCEQSPDIYNEDQTNHSAKKRRIRIFKASPKLSPTFASTLHKEGIRYIEQTILSADTEKEQIEHHKNTSFEANATTIDPHINVDKDNDAIRHKAECLYLLKSKEQSTFSNMHYQESSGKNEILNSSIVDKEPSHDSNKPDSESYDKEFLYYQEETNPEENTKNTQITESQTISPPLTDIHPLLIHRPIITYPPEADIEAIDFYAQISTNINRNMPYYHNYIEYDADHQPNQQNEPMEQNQTTKPMEHLSIAYLNDSRSNTDEKHVGMYMNRNMPYYYDHTKNIFFTQSPTHQNISSPDSNEPIRYNTDNSTDKNNEMLTPEESSNQSPTADETSSSDPELPQQRMYSREMELYYNKNHTYPDQYMFSSIPEENEQKTLSTKPNTSAVDNIDETSKSLADNDVEVKDVIDRKENILNIDANQDVSSCTNTFYDQNTQSSLYDDRVEQLKRLHTTLYTVDPIRYPPGLAQPESQFNRLGEYASTEEQSLEEEENPPADIPAPMSINTLKDQERRPPYDAHAPIDRVSYFQNIHPQIKAPETSRVPNGEVPQTQPEVATHFQSFHPHASFYRSNPYAYHQNYTYFGQYPQQNWQTEHKPEQIPANYQQQSDLQIPTNTDEAPESFQQNANISPDQKPKDETDLNSPTSMTFVSLPKAKWKEGTEAKQSLLPEEESEPDDKCQIHSTEVVSPTEVDIPDNMHLSTMLRALRRRNRQKFLENWARMHPLEGKCGKPRPPCPPPQPTCPPPKPQCPPACPPPPPPCPKPCKPKCPSPGKPTCPPPPPCCSSTDDPTCKFVAVSLRDTLYNVITLAWDLFIQKIPCCHSIETAECCTKAVTTQGITELHVSEGNNFAMNTSQLWQLFWRLETLALARGFEPWVPVPSFPVPIKKKKRPLVCPQEGCKERPPPRYGDPCDPPCTPGNPCQGFPNKYRNS